jgi:RNA recognition motif-containing protein
MQGSKLYVGNISYSATSDELKELFAQYGEVKQVNLMEGRGYGFVEMSSPEEAMKARDALNGTDFKGRTLKVDEARQPKDKQKRGFRKY